MFEIEVFFFVGILCDIEFPNSRRFVFRLKFLYIINVASPFDIRVYFLKRISRFISLHGFRINLKESFTISDGLIFIRTRIRFEGRNLLIQVTRFMFFCSLEFPLPWFIFIICIFAIENFFLWIKMISRSHILSNVEIRVISDCFVLFRDEHWFNRRR